MRVLHVGKYAPIRPGGMESYLGHLLAELEHQGVAVHGLVHGDPRQADVLPRYTVVPSYGRLLFAPVSPGFPRALDRAVESFAPDLLHIHLPNLSALWALYSARARALPWVLHWHADVAGSGGPMLRTGYRLYRRFEHRLLARSAAIVATSPAYLEASHTLRAWRDKTRVIPLGTVVAEPDPGGVAAVESDWVAGLGRILFVGRASYYKGLDRLLEAVAMANRAGLTVVGPGTREALAAEVRRRRLGRRVRLLGRQPADRVRALMATAQCLCLPSTGREEAFGMAAIEAMALGTPVLATDIAGSGLPWVVEAGVSGELVPVGDLASLARGLASVADDPGRWAGLGVMARERFRQRFDIRRSAVDLRALYDSVLAAREAAAGWSVDRE